LTEEKKVQRLHNLHQEVRAASRKVKKLTERLEEIAKI
jgi:hypothetical protein